MAKALKIVQEGDPVLRKRAVAVENPKAPEVQDLIADMVLIMKTANGIGLAAPQIGRPLRLFTVNVDGKIYVFVNPEVKDVSREAIPFEEGCLSVPKIWGPVIRPKKLTVKALNENGQPVKIRAKGLLARVIQHEMDHLNGMLFIDKAEKLYKIKEK